MRVMCVGEKGHRGKGPFSLYPMKSRFCQHTVVDFDRLAEVVFVGFLPIKLLSLDGGYLLCTPYTEEWRVMFCLTEG